MVNWHLQARQATKTQAARRRFVEHLHLTCSPGSDIAASEITCGELISNVVRHAPGAVEIQAKADEAGLVTLCVWDNGKGFAIKLSLPPDKCYEGGRGLFIVSTLAHHLSVRRTANGSTEACVVLPVVAQTANVER